MLRARLGVGLVMGQLAGHTRGGRRAPSAHAQVSSGIILRARQGGHSGRNAALRLRMHVSTRAGWNLRWMEGLHLDSDLAARKSLGGARGKHGLACARSTFRTCAAACESPGVCSCGGPARACTRAKAPLQPSGAGSSIPSPAGGLRAAGLSFIGLLGLVSGMPPVRTLLSAPSNAACCCSCAPPRRLPGPCRSHHHHPSPGRPPASISTVLTRPSAVRASFLPFPCTLCAGLVRRLQRPRRLRGRLEGRQEQRAPWPQLGRRRRWRFGRPDGRWGPRARPFGPLRRPSHAAAEQQQQHH